MSVGFMREKDIEALLVLETRDLPWPDGVKRPFTMTKWYWDAYEFLIVCTEFTPASLVAAALTDCAEMKRKFEDAFPNLLAYASNIARKKLGL